MTNAVNSVASVVVTLVLITTFPVKGYTEENGRVSAGNYLYSAYDGHTTDSSLRYILEDWATVTVGYRDFEANIVYEAHLPPPSWSPDTNGYGIYERWLTYKHNTYSATIGNFYPLLGKGITLKSLWKRELRYNTNFDGAQLQYANNYLDVTLLGGAPRNLNGVRASDPLQAMEVRVTPVQWGFAGLTYVQTGIPENGREEYWGSGYFQVQRDFGTLYAELGSLDFGRTSPPGPTAGNLFNGKGTAFYSTANLYVWNVSALLETAYYNNFSLVNAPPPSVLEHSHALMSRAQPTFDANNTAAMHVDLTWALSDENNISLSVSRSRAMEKDVLGTVLKKQGGVRALEQCLTGEPDYSDIFVKGEAVFPSPIDWSFGSGYQKSFEAGYLNFVATNDWGFAENYSMQGQIEHQLTTITLTELKYYSQLYGITVARGSSPRLSLGLIGETVVKPVTPTEVHREFWLGTQINWTINDNNEAVVFIGNRKEGKICSGGICVYKPEFSGVEVTVTSRF